MVTAHMADMARTSWEKAAFLVKNFDQKIADQVIELENDVDRYEDALGTYLLKLSSKNLSEKDFSRMTL